jgi:hypothetical protein
LNWEKNLSERDPWWLIQLIDLISSLMKSDASRKIETDERVERELLDGEIIWKAKPPDWKIYDW